MQEKVMRKHMEERFGKVFNYFDKPPLPKSLNIELNNTCNHACYFCPFHGEYALNPPKPSKLKIDFVKRILDQASELGVGEKEVGFYLAGEAFLYPELTEAVKYAKDLGFKYIFITSNGSLATPEKMKAVLNAGLDSIRFSVNATNREDYNFIHRRDDFDKVIDNLKFLKEYKETNRISLATSVSCVITKKNYDIRNEMRAFFENLVDDVVFIPISLARLKDRKKLADELAVYKDKTTPDPNFICPILFDTMYINSDGMVVPCCEAYDENVTFADLNKELNLEKAWYGEKYQKYRNIFLKNQSDKGTLCAHCTLRNNGMASMIME